MFPRARDAKRVFVKGLSAETGEADLVDYFSTFGQVKWAAIHRDAKVNKSRGLGLVAFASAESVDRLLTLPAIHIIQDCKISMSRSWKNEQPKYAEAHVRGLKPIHDVNNLTRYFSQFGKVHSVKTRSNNETCKSRYAFIRFYERESMERAVETEQHIIEDVPVLVNLSGKMVEAAIQQQAQSSNAVEPKDDAVASLVSPYSLPTRLEPQRPKKKLASTSADSSA